MQSLPLQMILLSKVIISVIVSGQWASTRPSNLYFLTLYSLKPPSHPDAANSFPSGRIRIWLDPWHCKGIVEGVSAEIFSLLELQFSEPTIASTGLLGWFVLEGVSCKELSDAIPSVLRDVILMVESGEEDMILLSLTSNVVTISSCTFTSNTWCLLDCLYHRCLL